MIESRGHGRRPHDARRVREGLVNGSLRWADVRVTGTTASTNADAADAARSGPASRVLLAELQTGGRGRLDRVWEAPAGAGLAMSLLTWPQLPVATWTWLPLLAGVAVCEAVEEVTRLRASVKWPNDVLLDGDKLAGVLVERVDTAHGHAAVVGIGLNVSMTAAELPVATATSLALAGATEVDRDDLAVAVGRRFDERLGELEAVGGDAVVGGLRDAYADRSSTWGAMVDVQLPGGDHLRGLVTGLDPGGRLLVRSEGRETPVAAGDVVHLRPAPDTGWE